MDAFQVTKHRKKKAKKAAAKAQAAAAGEALEEGATEPKKKWGTSRDGSFEWEILD
jgi:hypothetical protein